MAGTPLPNVDTSPMTLTVANGQAIQLTYDMLRDLTPEQIYKIYQTYIKELSVKVVDYSKAEQQDPELAEQVGGRGTCGHRPCNSASSTCCDCCWVFHCAVQHACGCECWRLISCMQQ